MEDEDEMMSSPSSLQQSQLIQSELQVQKCATVSTTVISSENITPAVADEVVELALVDSVARNEGGLLEGENRGGIGCEDVEKSVSGFGDGGNDNGKVVESVNGSENVDNLSENVDKRVIGGEDVEKSVTGCGDGGNREGNVGNDDDEGVEVGKEAVQSVNARGNVDNLSENVEIVIENVDERVIGVEDVERLIRGCEDGGTGEGKVVEMGREVVESVIASEIVEKVEVESVNVEKVEIESVNIENVSDMEEGASRNDDGKVIETVSEAVESENVEILSGMEEGVNREDNVGNDEGKVVEMVSEAGESVNMSENVETLSENVENVTEHSENVVNGKDMEEKEVKGESVGQSEMVNDVQEKLTQDGVMVEGGIGSENVGNVDDMEEKEVKGEVEGEGEMVSEVPEELIGDGVAVERVNESENVNDMEEKQVGVGSDSVGEMVCEVREELTGDTVMVEAVDRVNESENVQSASDTEEKLVGVRSDGLKEMVSEVREELTGDTVMVEAVHSVNESENVQSGSDTEEKQVILVSEGHSEMACEVREELAQDGVEGAIASKIVENVSDIGEEQVRLESEGQGEMASEVREELIGDGNVVETLEQVNASDMEEKQARVESDGQEEVFSEVKAELIGDGVVVETLEGDIGSKTLDNVSESVENLSENAKNVSEMEEKQVRVEGVGHGEMVSEVQEELIGDGVVVETVEGGIGSEIVGNVDDLVVVSEGIEVGNEVVVEKLEVVGEEVREKPNNDNKVEGDEVMKDVSEEATIVKGDGVVVEAVEGVIRSKTGDNVSENVENLSENAENVSDMEEKHLRVESVGQGEMVSEAREELIGDVVVVEGVGGIGSKIVENVDGVGEKQAKEETSAGGSEGIDVRNEVVVEKGEVVGEEVRETPNNDNKVEGDEVMKDESEEETIVKGDCVVVEAAEGVIRSKTGDNVSKNVENLSENAENVSDMEEKHLRVESVGQGEMVSEAREELIGHGVVVEGVEGGIESKIVENVDGVDEKQAKGETSVGGSEGIDVRNEVVVEKGEEIGEEVREMSIKASVVEGDEVMKDGGEEETVVKSDELSQVNENVQVTCEKTEVVSVDELGENKAVNDGKGNEVEVPGEEEGEEMDKSPVVKKPNKVKVIEKTDIVDVEMKPEKEIMESVSVTGEKRKRGVNSKSATPGKGSSRKVVTLVGEDVCFICLDGGELVLCDRRGCPKTYHPSCIDHDDALIKFKGHWTCGWHLCNKCRKNAYSMCYTCQFSLCKACSKDATFFCIRGNKGFCEFCMETIVMIENTEQNETGGDAFSDKSSWEYLFKDYWLEQKEKLCITSQELTLAKNRFKDFNRRQTSIEIHEGNNDAGTDSDSSHGKLELSNSNRKKAKIKSDSNTDSLVVKKAISGKGNSKKRLKDHTKTVNSDSDHSSPDTNRRGKKARRLTKSCSIGVNDGAAYESAGSNTKWASKELLEFVLHMKNGDQSVLTKFDVQDLLLEYIKRNKLRDPRRKSQIICDRMLQKLFGKPRVAHFEMAKLLESHLFLKDTGDNQGSGSDTEMRGLDSDNDTGLLVDSKKRKGNKSRKREQKASQSNLDDYAAIDRHNINLIFLRRNFMETLMENPETLNDKAIGSFVRIRVAGSNRKQEMYRLVQIIGTSKAAEPYKVGKRTTDVTLVILNLNKKETISIDTISNQEFSEDECERLRQSIKCGLIDTMRVGDIVEKARALNEVRVVNWLEAETARLTHLRDRASETGREKQLRECVEKLQLLKTPEERQRRLNEIPEIHADPKMDPSFESEAESDSSSEASGSRSRESRKDRDYTSPRKDGSTSSDSLSANARAPNQKLEPNKISFGKLFEREDLVENKLEPSKISEVDNGTPKSNNEEKPKMTSETSTHVEQSSVAGKTDSKSSESEKIWHYRDPTEKVQGPFSIMQLRKWSAAGYFPPELRIWKTTLSETDSILLTDILVGKLDKEMPAVGPTLNADSAITNVPSSVDTSKPSENAPNTISINRVHAQVSNSQSTAPVGNQAPPSNNAGYAGQGNITTTNVVVTPAQNAQVSIGQWTAPVANQAPSNNGGYAGRGNVTTTNMVITPAQNAQVSNGQWTAPVGNQAPSNIGGYAGQGNITTTNMVITPAQYAWRPTPTNMPSNMSRAGPPRNPPMNTPGRGGDQRGRQPSFGGGRPGICWFHESGHCKKGASCNYWHAS